MFENPPDAAAYHEAGHVIAALALGWTVKSVTIKPTDDTAGVALVYPSRQHWPISAERAAEVFPHGWEQPKLDRERGDLERAIMVSLAGYEAQALYTGENFITLETRGPRKGIAAMREWYIWWESYQKQGDVPGDLVDAFEMLENVTTDHHEMVAYLRHVQLVTRRFIGQRYVLVDWLAKALLVHETLTYAQIEGLFALYFAKQEVAAA